MGCGFLPAQPLMPEGGCAGLDPITGDVDYCLMEILIMVGLGDELGSTEMISE
jgi:hypothetical protein